MAKQPGNVFKNRDYEIPEGSNVTFLVENMDQWTGDLCGQLIVHDGEFKVKTPSSTILTIGKRYDVYPNTITPAN